MKTSTLLLIGASLAALYYMKKQCDKCKESKKEKSDSVIAGAVNEAKATANASVAKVHDLWGLKRIFDASAASTVAPAINSTLIT